LEDVLTRAAGTSPVNGYSSARSNTGRFPRVWALRRPEITVVPPNTMVVGFAAIESDGAAPGVGPG
jgi:hypothetical protein